MEGEKSRRLNWIRTGVRPSLSWYGEHDSNLKLVVWETLVSVVVLEELELDFKEGYNIKEKKYFTLETIVLLTHFYFKLRNNMEFHIDIQFQDNMEAYMEYGNIRNHFVFQFFDKFASTASTDRLLKGITNDIIARSLSSID